MGMNYSKKRDLVLQTVLQGSGHPTADDIYTRLKADNPDLSLATVYRNLNLLVEIGAISKLSLPGTADRFDFICEKHYHFRCIRCKEIYDIETGTLDELDHLVSQESGHQVQTHELFFEGICRNCATK